MSTGSLKKNSRSFSRENNKIKWTIDLVIWHFRFADSRSAILGSIWAPDLKLQIRTICDFLYLVTLLTESEGEQIRKYHFSWCMVTAKRKYFLFHFYTRKRLNTRYILITVNLRLHVNVNRIKSHPMIRSAVTEKEVDANFVFEKKNKKICVLFILRKKSKAWVVTMNSRSQFSEIGQGKVESS